MQPHPRFPTLFLSACRREWKKSETEQEWGSEEEVVREKREKGEKVNQTDRKCICCLFPQSLSVARLDDTCIPVEQKQGKRRGTHAASAHLTLTCCHERCTRDMDPADPFDEKYIALAETGSLTHTKKNRQKTKGRESRTGEE